MHINIKLAKVTDSAVRHTYFAFLYFNAGSGDGISNIMRTDRTEQLAFLTGYSRNGDLQFGQLGSASFGFSLLRGSCFFQLGTTQFKSSDVFRSSGGSLALRQQVVTTVTGLDIHFVAQVAQVGEFFQQNDFNLSLTS